MPKAKNQRAARQPDFGQISAGDDHLVAGARGVDRSEQQAPDGTQLPIEPQLAIALGHGAVTDLELPAGDQQREGHGQVVAPAFLGKLDRREVYGDATRRKFIAAVENG